MLKFRQYLNKNSLTISMFALFILLLVASSLFFHDDLAAEYWRTYQFGFLNNWDYFSTSRVLSSIIHYINLSLVSPLIPNLANIMPETGLGITYYYPDSQAFLESWQEFLRTYNIGLIALLFKLPYLVAMLIGGIVFGRIFADEKVNKAATWIWLLAPTTIFTTALWGRFDILVAALFVIMLYFLHKEKLLHAVFVFIAAVLIKSTALFVAPFFLIYLIKKLRIRKSLALVMAGIVGLLFVAIDHYLNLGLLSITQTPHFRYLFELQASVSHYLFSEAIRTIYIFPLLLFLLSFHYWRSNSDKLTSFVGYTSIGILLYYITSYFHPHYFIWVIPFMVYLAAQKKQLLELFTWQQVAYLFIFVIPFMLSFFIPLMQGAFEMPQVIANFITSQYYLGAQSLGYVFFTGINIYLSIYIFKYLMSEEKS